VPGSTIQNPLAALEPDLTATAGRLRLAVSRLARKMRRNAETGITLSQISALVAIERATRLTIGELAAAEQIRPPSMTRIVSSLEEAGLVRRTPDASDRRIGWLTLTSDGARRLARIRGRKNAYLTTRLKSLSPTEIRLIERALPLLERIAEEPD
jgi:DNA-binding MarR family transcriptional regulator